jgi:MFS family permease
MRISSLNLKIISGGVILAIAVGIRQSFGLFLEPISLDLNLGRESFALTIGLVNLLWGICAPFTGAISDKYGTGKVVLCGAMFYCLGLYLIGMADNETNLLFGGILIGIGLSGLGFTVILGAIGRAVPKNKRGTALGLASMGGSIGMFAAIPMAGKLIQDYSWSIALLTMVIMAAIIVPFAYGMRGKSNISTKDKQVENPQSVIEALKEAMTHRNFILLTIGFFICGFHVNFIVTHLPAYLSDLSFDSSVATTALALVGLANIFGVIIAGKIGDHMEKSKALVYFYSLRSIVFIIYVALPITPISTLIFTFTLGLLWLGTVPLTSGLVAAFFGVRYMSMLYGIVFLSHQIGGFASSWLGGYLYDISGNYNLMWGIYIFLGLFAASIHYPIRECAVVRKAQSTQSI